ncbi:hypothetical protein O6H91_03G090500 [Diphasiastrum complanatum]|nr:hypothetical protein O6H91_03G090500 [Diphasiastrum complanatum]
MTTLRSAIPIPVFAVPSKPRNNPTDNATYGFSIQNDSHSHATLAIIVGVLSTISSLAFLVLLYTTRCRRRSSSIVQQPGAATATPASNGGLDQAIIEHLPLFSFKSLKGNTCGLECAVCLSHYEDSDILRLLPSCQHAFHVECIDKWLVSQSSCPLCRHEVSSEDTLLVDSILAARRSLEEAPDFGVPRRSLERLGSATLQMHVTRDEVVDESSPRSSQQSHHDGMMLGPGKSENRVATCEAARLSSPRKRRLAHRIVISDVLLQQRWSDLAPADVLFLNSQTIFGPISSNIRLSFSSEGKPRWSTSSATRLSTSSPATSAIEIAQVQKHFDPRSDFRDNITSKSHFPNLLASEACILEDIPSGEINSSSRKLNIGEAQRSLSEITGLDRFSQSSSRELFSSGTLLYHQAAQDGDDEKIGRWLRIASRTLKRLIRKDIRLRPSLDEAANVPPHM